MRYSIIVFVALSTLFLTSCENRDSRFEILIKANAVLATKTEVRNSIAVVSPQAINESGKIYTYLNFIFVNDLGQGIHVIDNSDPTSPQKVAYIKVPGNYDIEVRNNILYADSYGDLVLFDISNIDNITMISLTEDVFNVFSFAQAPHTQPFDFTDYGEQFDFENNYVVGWTYESVQIEVFEDDDVFILNESASPSGNNVGQGGSFARFKIVDTYLYVVDLSDLYTFNIATPGEATFVDQQNIGWQIETIFNQDDFLYIGSSNGMIIYSIENPSAPQYASEIQHLTGCDPVVVDGDYAYLTLRGGNGCGQEFSILEVIDVSDRYNPLSLAEYPMEEPYGLGFKGDYLYVSDGTFGFKIYNKSNPLDLILVNTIENINVFDVIPQEERLLAIAENILYQYSYNEDTLDLISEFAIE